jgi:hypothetical protein
MSLPFIVGGLASVASSIIGANAAKKAAKAQTQAANAANTFDQNMHADTVGRFQPYETAGRNALSIYQGALGLGGDPNSAASAAAAFRNSPGYQAQLDEGTRALDMSAASRGGLFSGGRAKAAMRFGQGLADQNYQQWLGGVRGVVGMGESAAGNVANANNALATRYGDRLTGAGRARAEGYINAGNAVSGGIQDVAGLANYYRPGGKSVWG